MSVRDRDKWNERHANSASLSMIQPDEWLGEAIQIVESSSPRSTRRALDIACGRGHNAIWLARQGWRADAVDISSAGLELARESAASNDVQLHWIEADLDDWVPATDEYDLAVVFRFLDRETVPRVVRTAIRPGGWLVYETFSSAQCARSDNRIQNPEFTLAQGELPTLFPDFDAVVHREDALHDRTVERFLARRRGSDPVSR